jgi:hypothetical protein
MPPPLILKPMGAYLSLHARLQRFELGDLEHALYEQRSLVRLKAMRGTVFLCSRHLAPLTFAATRAATVASDRRWLLANDEVYAHLAPKALATLDGQSMTAAELRTALSMTLSAACAPRSSRSRSPVSETTFS